jgi:hypothetical protein
MDKEEEDKKQIMITDKLFLKTLQLHEKQTQEKKKTIQESTKTNVSKTREFIARHMDLSEQLVPFDLQLECLLFLNQQEKEIENKIEKEKEKEIEKEKTNLCKYIKQEMKKKIRSYRHQDEIKQLYDSTNFIDYAFLLNKMVKCKMKCFYCACNLFVFYDKVREKYQWTVDRIDNKIGHTKTNFVLSCFACNMKRRCQHMEKFYFTKKLVLKKVPAGCLEEKINGD